MSNYTMQEGQFSLFRNQEKTESNQPDYTGKVLVNGKEMRMAAWLKEGKGGKFLSGKLSEFDKSKSVKTKNVQNESDGLPF